MADTTKIEWARNSDGSPGSTFNPWVGCAKVGPGCDHCYAEAWAKRSGTVQWGNHARRRTSPANWARPLKWNRDAERLGIRRRVFCASLADVFDNKARMGWRAELWALIRATPHLDWIIVTKRIRNARGMLPSDWGPGYPNIWLVATVCTQREADRDVELLLETPAAVHGLSMEPLLEAVNLLGLQSRHPMQWFDPLAGEWENPYGAIVTRGPMPARLDWIIVGGESGPGARPMHPLWVRSLRDHCQMRGAAFFFKQWGEWAWSPDSLNFDQGEAWARGLGARRHEHHSSGHTAALVGKQAAGRLFEGLEWNGMPDLAAARARQAAAGDGPAVSRLG